MLGLAREELSDAWATEKIKDYDTAVALYQSYGGVFRSIETMRADITNIASTGLASALNNGLDDNENRELMNTCDAQRVVELVLRGLGKI